MDIPNDLVTFLRTAIDPIVLECMIDDNWILSCPVDVDSYYL